MPDVRQSDIGEALRSSGGLTVVEVLVTTNAPRDEVSGFDGWRKRIEVRVRARPVEEKANKALLSLFSATFGIPKGGVVLLRGRKGREKSVGVKLGLTKVRAVLERYIDDKEQ